MKCNCLHHPRIYKYMYDYTRYIAINRIVVD